MHRVSSAVRALCGVLERPTRAPFRQELRVLALGADGEHMRPTPSATGARQRQYRVLETAAAGSAAEPLCVQAHDVTKPYTIGRTHTSSLYAEHFM